MWSQGTCAINHLMFLVHGDRMIHDASKIINLRLQYLWVVYGNHLGNGRAQEA